MCKDLQENKINKMKFHEEIEQFIEQFKNFMRKLTNLLNNLKER